MDAVILSSLGVICFWFCFWIYVWQSRKDPLHPLNLFILLYVITYPVKLILTQYGIAVLDSRDVGSEFQIQALLLSSLASFCFCLPFLIWDKKSVPPCRPSQRLETGFGWLFAYLLFFYLSYDSDFFLRIFSTESLRELIFLRGERRLNSAINAIATYTSEICLYAHLFICARSFPTLPIATRGLLAVCWLVISVLALGISGSKYSALLPFATFFFLRSFWAMREGSPWGLLRVGGCTIAGFLGIALTSYVRGFDGFRLSYFSIGERLELMGKRFSFAFDAPDNLSFILARINSIWDGDLHFQPTLDYIFRAPLPRFLWEDKPLYLGNLRIMSHYFPERFTDYTGEVISPSMAGEMILSGGVGFMILWSFFLGACFTLIYRRACATTQFSPSVVVYIWLCLNIFNIHRSGTGIVAPAVIMALLALTLLILNHVLFGWRSSTNEGQVGHEALEQLPDAPLEDTATIREQPVAEARNAPSYLRHQSRLLVTKEVSGTEDSAVDRFVQKRSRNQTRTPTDKNISEESGQVPSSE